MARTSIGKRSVGRDGALHVHGKASNGEGSIYRDSDGAWRATYSVPGEARPRQVLGKTREEAIARRAAKLEELSQIQSSTFHRDATVAELAAWWLDVVARHRVRPSTFGTYRDRVQRITDTLGVMPVRAVKPERVARWQSDLLKSGLASGTVADVRVTLHQVLEQAVIHELIASNPVDRVAAPKVTHKSAWALTSEEARRLVETASVDRLGAAVALLFVQGGACQKRWVWRGKTSTRAWRLCGAPPSMWMARAWCWARRRTLERLARIICPLELSTNYGDGERRKRWNASPSVSSGGRTCTRGAL